MRAVDVVIHGRVQGVGFRWSTRKLALDLGLLGWVRNASDGTVEALFVGDDSAVARMLAWCAEGPPGAHVTHVDHRDIDEDDVEVDGFDVVHASGR